MHTPHISGSHDFCISRGHVCHVLLHCGRLSNMNICMPKNYQHTMCFNKFTAKIRRMQFFARQCKSNR